MDTDDRTETPLARLLRRQILADGPQPVSAIMALALTHPEAGYYTTRDPFGARGDFTTAPEISQIFGELVGLFFLQHWLDLGAPAPLHLVELGPGRGTLMADALRAAALRPAFGAALRLHLVEVSPVLKAAQARALGSVSPRWHGHAGSALAAAEAEGGALFVLGNEFLDALPIRQFVHARGAFRERLVGLAPDGAFTFGLGGPVPSGIIDPPAGAASEGTLLERCPEAEALLARLAGLFRTRMGLALFIDYGSSEDGTGDTLQAMAAHGPAPVLEALGGQDLTAHVNFARLRARARAEGAAVHGPVTQGAFLEALGLSARAARLAERGADADILAGARRLADPSGMGTLFKAMAIGPEGAPPPPGFDTALDRPAPDRRSRP
ncbi:MAG: SAM-dependent methyltransferase [Alphaproteobacteria bacterium]|nr:SAM-dependent methyltransferase [Alphaproteobacteria bacterium]